MVATDDPVDGDTRRRRAADDSARHASAHPRLRRRVPWLLTLALTVLLVGWGAWLAYDAVQARRELLAAAELLAGLQDDVLAGDTDVAETLAQVQERAAAAREATHGLHWTAAGALPWAGENVRAVQAVSEVVDSLARNVLPDLAEVAEAVKPSTLAPVDGRVDLAPLEQAAPVVVAAAEQVAAGQRRLDLINADRLWASVAEPLTDLREKLAELSMTTATASRAVQLLPAMLGADGPRTYLVLVQNPAEPRATGGVPAVVVVRADGGVVSVVEQGSSGVGNLHTPALPLTAEEDSLFSHLVGSYLADVTFTPDFPRSGELAQAIWSAETGDVVDGVVSVDPAAISSLLRIGGPVTLSDGTQLTGDNAPEWLANTVYLRYGSVAERDALFAEATIAAFTALMSGGWEPGAMTDALAADARAGHLMIWSADPAEQALLSGTVLSGELVGVRGYSPVIGVYVNDGSQSKMGYYLKADVTATTTECRADRSQAITLTVELTSVAPEDAAELPDYISGGHVLPAGQMRENILVYAPAGGLVDNVRVVGAEEGVHAQSHEGLAVTGKTLVFAPGDSVVLEYDILSGPGQPGTPVLRTTPLAMVTTSVGGEQC